MLSLDSNEVGPVQFDSMVIDDDDSTSSGNNDGIVNCGETIELQVWLENLGSAAAADVSATLSTSDPYVTISDSIEAYFNIAAGGVAKTQF